MLIQQTAETDTQAEAARMIRDNYKIILLAQSNIYKTKLSMLFNARILRILVYFQKLYANVEQTTNY